MQAGGSFHLLPIGRHRVGEGEEEFLAVDLHYATTLSPSQANAVWDSRHSLLSILATTAFRMIGSLTRAMSASFLAFIQVDEPLPFLQAETTSSTALVSAAAPMSAFAAACV